ncbi:UNVERIFIED_ORG: hypothetical protein ABIC97_000070 [Peribacillus simplex]
MLHDKMNQPTVQLGDSVLLTILSGLQSREK